MAEQSDIQIACLGDIMCGDQFNHIGWGAASEIEKRQEKFLDDSLVAMLKSHDIVIGNIECILSDVGRDENAVRSLHMRGRPETAVLLKEWGVTVAHLANNHILEQGRLAAEDTAVVLSRAGLTLIGVDQHHAFSDSPQWVQLQVKGQTVSLFGFCLRNEKYAYCVPCDIPSLCREIKERRQSGHVVIISVHWGDELINRPSLSQRNIAAQLLEAGAAVIAGHHPHVVQGVTCQSGQLVAYSLGNFIFDSWCPQTAWSMALSLAVRDGQVIDYQTVPLERSRCFSPVSAQGRHCEKLQDEIRLRNRLAKDAVENTQQYQDDYQRELRRLNLKDRLSLWCRIICYFWKCQPRYWAGILLRPIQRRMGKW